MEEGSRRRLAAVLALVLGVCLLALGVYGILNLHTRRQIAQLRRRAAAPASVEGGEPGGLAGLAGENPDLAGWVRIEGTNLDYPVMFTPGEPEYYLRRGFDGKYSLSGTPFLDGACDPQQGASLLIYGHNMSDGSMFAALHSYLEPEFLARHPSVEFATLERKEAYKILAVLKFDLTQENLADYYALPASEAEFEQYLAFVQEQSVLETGVTAHWGDRLLMLSTCSEHAANGRVMVVAASAGE